MNNEKLKKIKNHQRTTVYEEQREQVILERWKTHIFALHHKNVLDKAFIDICGSIEILSDGKS